MPAFTTLKAVAVPLNQANIDTNQLAPTRFSKVPRGPQYAQILFSDQRFNADGSETDHILNRGPYRHAAIIVAERNFGCGSSRETAVYALYEFGIRCVIAPSFGDIFAGNCYKNGLLPVVLSDVEVAAIRCALEEKPGAEITVDLRSQTLVDPKGRRYTFNTHPVQRKCLLEGLDDIARTTCYDEKIQAFEAKYRIANRWLYQ